VINGAPAGHSVTFLTPAGGVVNSALNVLINPDTTLNVGNSQLRILGATLTNNGTLIANGGDLPSVHANTGY